MVLRCVFVLIPLLTLCRGAGDLNERYRFNTQLNGDAYVLFWNFDLQQENISFAVRVRTTGWVGFGISRKGLMPQSDVVIGWVGNNQQVYLQDRFAVEYATPPIDGEQNWFLIRAEEADGYTTLEFWRKFSTCDDRDNSLSATAETAWIVWSYHTNDPVNATGVFPRHTARGSRNLNLLGRLPRERSVPADAANFTIRNNNFLIPNTSNTIWCSYHVHDVPPGEIYIYKATPIISPESVPYVHHKW